MDRHEIARQRRALGQFFTPPDLARWMARGLWEDWQAGQTAGTAISPVSGRLSTGPSLLDPACGEGALLQAAAVEWIRLTQSPASAGQPDEGLSSAHPRPLPRLAGVECDQALIAQCRSLWPSQPGAPPSELAAIPLPQLHWGDALTGPAFGDVDLAESFADSNSSASSAPGRASPVNWNALFPTEAADGGFDLILGNPPYVRERGQRALFAGLAQTPLGRRWHQPRMDLAHYFLHRALDLLKPGGCLTFVMSVYWSRADSAAPLLSRLRTDCQPIEWIQLGNRPLFAGVQGHHAVFRLRRRPLGSDTNPTAPEFARLRQVDTAGSLDEAWRAAEVRTLPLDEFFDTVLRPASHQVFGPRVHRAPGHQPAPATGVLADEFEVRQGIAENPPRLTRAQLRTWPDLPPVGTGVFVLTSEELRHLALSPAEAALVRPYHRPQAIQRFHLSPEPVEWLLYLTPRTAPRLEDLPAIAQHLARFRPVLERRREVVRGVIEWWHLHWPREERLFQHPKILGIQMGATPRFAFVPQPAFTGFSTHVIVPRQEVDCRPLPVLTALLNSDAAHEWFAARAKLRGAKFDISGGLLRQFPLPSRDRDREPAVERLVRQLARQPDHRLDQQLQGLLRPWWP
jgi:adenine-specific DNA-methyltransferase